MDFTRLNTLRALPAVVALLLTVPSSQAQPISSCDEITIESITLPDQDSAFSLEISLRTHIPTIGVFIPLDFSGLPDLVIDTTVSSGPDARGITHETLGNSGVWDTRSTVVDNAARTIRISYVAFGGELPPSDGPLLRLHFRLNASGNMGVNIIDSTQIAADQLSIYDSLTTMIIPQFTAGEVCVGTNVAGDVNADGQVSSADLIYMVNHVFKGGPDPVEPCPR